MNITYDGADATGIVNQSQKAFVRLAIPVSAIAEFRVTSGLPTAEYGDAGGAQIAVVSPAGTNRWKIRTYVYYDLSTTTSGEHDHLVPLELGGANASSDLWIEPGASPTPRT